MGDAAESVLVPAGVLGAAEEAAFLIVGLLERWAREGLGAAAGAGQPRPPAQAFVRRGLCPGGMGHPRR
jgi:hypothetical protein